MVDLVKLNRAASAIFAAVDEKVAKNISDLLLAASKEIKTLRAEKEQLNTLPEAKLTNKDVVNLAEFLHKQTNGKAQAASMELYICQWIHKVKGVDFFAEELNQLKKNEATCKGK